MHGHYHGCSPRSDNRLERSGEARLREWDKPRDPALRASDRDRDETVRALSEHAASGRLTLDEFEQRVGAAYTAKRLGELEPLLADLPATRASSVERPRAEWRPWRTWLLVAATCLAIWAMTSISSERLVYFWPIWVIGPWGVSMLMRGVGSRTRAGRPTG